jgi:hypothetical protein
MSIQNSDRFNESLQRLTGEVRTIRCDFAALAAFRARRKEYFRSELTTLLFNGLKGDLMARLSRVFEDHEAVASFWYLHRCDPKRVESDLDLPKLKEFSHRLKTARDTTFSHIDKRTVADPDRPYREAAITYDEIQDAAESVWRTLARLQRETFQNVPDEKFDQPLRDLIEMYASELAEVPTR